MVKIIHIDPIPDVNIENCSTYYFHDSLPAQSFGVLLCTNCILVIQANLWQHITHASIASRVNVSAQIVHRGSIDNVYILKTRSYHLHGSPEEGSIWVFSHTMPNKCTYRDMHELSTLFVPNRKFLFESALNDIEEYK